MKDIITKKIGQIRKEAEHIGAVAFIDAERFIDDEHLNCFWYGGETLGLIKLSNGWTVHINVCGIVRLSGTTEDGTEIDYENDSNDGAWGKDVASIIKNDEHLRALEEVSLMEWQNNNWVEFNLVDPDGKYHECGDTMDNILDENVLDAFLPVSAFMDTVKEFEFSSR